VCLMMILIVSISYVCSALIGKDHIIMTIQEIGLTIKERRQMLRMIQPDLAEMAQISINTLYKIERGEANPSVKVLNKLAEVLGMELILSVKKPA